MLQELQDVNLILRSQVIGDIYAYVNENSLYEFIYPSARNPPNDLQRHVFTREAYRRSLCGMLKYTAQNVFTSNSYHYVVIHINTNQRLSFQQELSTSALTCPCNSQITSFIFEYQQGDKTLFFLATLTNTEHILNIFTVLRSNYEAYMGISIDYKYLVDEIESYVYLHTPGVTTLVTRYTYLSSVPLQFSTFDNFVSLLIKFSDMSRTPTSIKHTHLQHFTTIQLLLAVQCVYTLDPNSVDLLLDEVNFIDKLNQILPPLSDVIF